MIKHGVCRLETCKKPFSFDTKDKKKQYFCNVKCSQKWHKIKNAHKYAPIAKEAIKRVWRVCLGIICRGEKKFRSEGIGNRICPKCSVVVEYGASSPLYDYKRAGRTSKSL